MFNRKHIILLLLLIIGLCAISCASATDNNDSSMQMCEDSSNDVLANSSQEVSSQTNSMASNPTENATVKKSPVTMKVSKTTSYKGRNRDFTIHGIITDDDMKELNNKGFKVTVKAVVKSQGKNINEGTVKFKISGKTYEVAVKDGVATKTLKFKKAKNYKVTATFTSDNYLTKTVKEKETVKKRHATKITAKKSISGNSWKSDQKITFKVTSNGKKVKNGYLHIYDKTNGYNYYVSVKNGKAKFSFVYLNNYYSIGDDGLYYHNKVVTKYKVSYVPMSLKYKASYVNFKKTVYYKCPFCGKTGTHNHFPYTKHIVTYD